MLLIQNFRILPVKRVILLAILMVLLLLVVTVLLLPEQVQRPAQQTAGVTMQTAPSLTLSKAFIKVGQPVKVHIVHFTPSTNVFVTHDIGVAVKTNTGSSTIKVRPDGTADIQINIDKSWQPGWHLIGAEDTAKRYTASVSLQVVA